MDTTNWKRFDEKLPKYRLMVLMRNTKNGFITTGFRTADKHGDILRTPNRNTCKMSAFDEWTDIPN